MMSLFYCTSYCVSVHVQLYMLCANQGSVTIRGLRCAKHGSALCAGNPWIVQLLRNPRIAQLTRAYVYSVSRIRFTEARWIVHHGG